ncbi:Phage shock protein PspC (stress-responsive transcriptional regulator) [Blastococcus tunisiensis]|uniref:Phage shock protein PspC (Stress-responsive transcriptional regulator) n=2 Tax=Blastococcus tunisiensis TaxID=1798228 RepID=A0A1I1W978_9ACTN|nr:Phage shock protein PspC (stress-responsive transcriptional regulator) [Blastococcus sp. DSM 46838]
MEPPSWPPPPPEGPQPVRPQLRRSRTDKILGGVNGGLAEYTGIDALLWRVGFVALTLAAGTGVIVYLLLWVLMPAGPPAAAGAPGTAGVPGTVQAPAGPRSPVPRITVAALLIVAGLMAMIANFSDWDIGPRGVLGTLLAVVGLGLVATAFSNRRSARGGLVALGVVLSLALLTVSTVDVPGSGGVGERSYRPTTAAEVRPLYEIGAGEMTVDLSDVDLSDLDEPIRTTIEHGVGDLNVIVPRSADVSVRLDQGIGDARVFGSDDADDGRLVPGTGSAAWTDDDQAEFVLTIDLGVGDVEVSRG